MELARFEEVIRRRRSVRRYDQSQRLSRELIRGLIEDACRAPSNFNRQPWTFVVLDEKPWIDALSNLLRRGVDRVEERDKAGKLFNLLDHVRAWLYPLETSTTIVLSFYKPSPEIVDEQISTVLEGGDINRYNPNLIALGMAIENLLLAAEAQGIGACMHSGPLPFLRGAVNRLLNLPERLELAGLISMGYPDEVPRPQRRKPLEKHLRFCEGPVPPEWDQVWT